MRSTVQVRPFFFDPRVNPRGQLGCVKVTFPPHAIAHLTRCHILSPLRTTESAPLNYSDRPRRKVVPPVLRLSCQAQFPSEVIMPKGSGSRIALLFVFCAAFLVGGFKTHALKASALPPIIAQNRTQNAPEVRTFTGKVLSQNGERFILRDEANDVWYHLDDQQQARKFAGRNVLVTGVLDGRTDMIQVREITEVKA